MPLWTRSSPHSQNICTGTVHSRLFFRRINGSIRKKATTLQFRLAMCFYDGKHRWTGHRSDQVHLCV